MELLLYLTNALCYAGQSATGKLHAAKGGHAHGFNFFKAISATALFFLWCILKGSQFHFPTLGYGIVYGIFLMASMHCGFCALSFGPLSMTSMVAAMSLVVPLFWGLLFWEERLTLLAITGILLLIVAIFFICSPKKEKLSKKWLFYSVATLLCNGICSVVQKYHQRSYPGNFQPEFMFFAMSTVSLILVFVMFGNRKPMGKPMVLGTLSGIFNGLANFSVLFLAATENATSLFPLISAGNIMIACVVGFFFFHDHIQPRQLLGLFSGIAGMILLKL